MYAYVVAAADACQITLDGRDSDLNFSFRRMTRPSPGDSFAHPAIPRAVSIITKTLVKDHDQLLQTGGKSGGNRYYWPGIFSELAGDPARFPVLPNRRWLGFLVGEFTSSTNVSHTFFFARPHLRLPSRTGELHPIETKVSPPLCTTNYLKFILESNRNSVSHHHICASSAHDTFADLDAGCAS